MLFVGRYAEEFGWFTHEQERIHGKMRFCYWWLKAYVKPNNKSILLKLLLFVPKHLHFFDTINRFARSRYVGY